MTQATGLPGQRMLSFPLGGADETGRRPWSEGVDSIREVLWNILMTEPGERVMRPEFGAGLPGFLHRPNTLGTRQIIADVARAEIARNEPRIDIVEITVNADPLDPGIAVFSLLYRMRATGAEDRMDLSLSLAGGA